MVKKQRRYSFNECMRLMRKHDVEMSEYGFQLLKERATEYIDDFIVEFHREKDSGLRCWILDLITEARSEKAFPLLVECLRGDDDHLWGYAAWGLQHLGTKEARQVLWEAQSYRKGTDEATAYFQQELGRV